MVIMLTFQSSDNIACQELHDNKLKTIWCCVKNFLQPPSIFRIANLFIERIFLVNSHLYCYTMAA